MQRDGLERTRRACLHRPQSPRRAGLAVLLLAGALALAGCAETPKRYSTGTAFRDTNLLETQLKKGISSVDEVRRLLGEPTGSGAVLLSAVQQQPEEMWFYQDIEITDIKPSQGQLDLKMRQQILIVFVRDGLFDGFMWFSNDEPAIAWIKDSLRGKVGR